MTSTLLRPVRELAPPGRCTGCRRLLAEGEGVCVPPHDLGQLTGVYRFCAEACAKAWDDHQRKGAVGSEE